MARLLLVDDEPDLLAPLAWALEAAGHACTCVGTGEEAIQALEAAAFDLMTLDMMLPDRSGADVCRAVRTHERYGRIGVVMVSARADEFDKVVAFEAGADDYVTKPFSLRELQLRIEARLRRLVNPVSETRLEISDIIMDFESQTCWSKGEQVDLTTTEWRLLEVFLRSPTRALTRENLMSKVWGDDHALHHRTVDTNVKRLRQKLALPDSLLTTVRGVGYRWMGAEA